MARRLPAACPSVVTLPHAEAGRLVRAAAAGDRLAWERLVEAHTRLIWAIIRSYRLSAGDAADVSQTTWLRLLEHMDRLVDPGQVAAWLVTTARRECLRVQARGQRTTPVADSAVFERAQECAWPAEIDSGLLAAERDAAVRAAVDALPSRCRELLQLMMLDPPPSYEEMSAVLGRPVGSLGPSRRRCLEKLRALLDGTGVAPRCARAQ